MRTIKRAIHMDFHTMPDIPDFSSEFDASAFAEGLRRADVDWITFFARCNIGYSYYETKVGLKHPGYREDMLGGVLRECHRRDIAVAAYINAGLNHAFADLHRDWLVVNKDGSIYKGSRTGNFFRNMCYNTPYRAHLKAELAELLADYPELDGYFFDCMAAFPCFCSSCVDRMTRDGVDMEDEDAVLLFSARIRSEVAAELRAMIPKDKFVLFNGSFHSGVPYASIAEGQSHHEIECLPNAPAWGYETFPNNVAYARNVLDQVVFMTGRFQTNWGDYGGLRPRQAMEFDCFYALAQGAVCSVGDHLHPRGRLEPAVYDAIGEVFGKVRETEPWTLHAKAVTDIGVLFHKDTAKAMETQMQEGLWTALGGAARMLGELKYQFDIVDDTMDISRFKLVILPDSVRLPEEAMKKLEDYIKGGGKVLSSGSAGLNAGGAAFASKLWPFEYKGPDTWDNGFYKPGPALLEGCNDMPTAIYRPGILMEAGEGAQVLAEYWQPYFSRHWDGHQGYFYIPFDKPSGEAAVAATEDVAHVCFPIFTAYQQTMAATYKYLLRNLIRRLMPQPVLEAELPSYARASLTKKAHCTLLHILSYCPEFRAQLPVLEEPVVLHEVPVRIRTKAAPKKVYSVPDQTPCHFTWKNGVVELVVPRVEGHAMLALED